MTLQAHYEDDAEMLRTMSNDDRERFSAWIAELNTEHIKAGSPYGDEPIEYATGLTCWKDYFDDDYTPAHALAEDLSND